MSKKQIVIKIDTNLFTKFSELCVERGYSKTGWLTAKIRELIKENK